MKDELHYINKNEAITNQAKISAFELNGEKIKWVEKNT